MCKVPPASRHEVANPLLWRDALIEVLVSGEDDLDLVLEEHGLYHGSDDVAALRRMFPGRVERMVEEGESPLLAGVREDGAEPLGLIGIGRVIAVQDREADVALVERIVVAILHVEGLKWISRSRSWLPSAA
jgi:hypothetical protein